MTLFLHFLINHHLLDLLQLKLLLQLLPPTSILNLRKLTITVYIGYLVHSLIVYMIFIMNIRLPKNYGYLSRKNMSSMMSKLKDLPPLSSINSWWLIVNQSMINFMNFKIISNTFNCYKVSCLIDKLPLFWSAFAGDLRHKQCDITLTQTPKVIRIENQNRQNSKIKSE